MQAVFLFINSLSLPPCWADSLTPLRGAMQSVQSICQSRRPAASILCSEVTASPSTNRALLFELRGTTALSFIITSFEWVEEFFGLLMKPEKSQVLKNSNCNWNDEVFCFDSPCSCSHPPPHEVSNKSNNALPADPSFTCSHWVFSLNWSANFCLL